MAEMSLDMAVTAEALLPPTADDLRTAGVDPDAAVALVDLAALRHNLAFLRASARPGTRVLAAVKADAYGHGAVPVARCLAEAGVDAFGVATADEAMELRRAGIGQDLLLLSPVRGRVAELVEAGVSLTVSDGASLEVIEAARPSRPAKVHLKLDTGMGRLGLSADHALRMAAAVDRSPAADLQGLWTHFASADEEDEAGLAQTREQLSIFQAAVARLETAGLRPDTVHAANSATVLTQPDAHFDMVRPGIAVYGQPPSPELGRRFPGLQPALQLSAPITFVKRVAAGTPVGYGAQWRAPHDTVIATVRLGYADGYPRALASKGWAALDGRMVPVAGRICMDQLMLDLGPQGDAQPGDRAVFYGGRGGPVAEDVAETAGINVYELLTRLGRRVVRLYR